MGDNENEPANVDEAFLTAPSTVESNDDDAKAPDEDAPDGVAADDGKMEAVAPPPPSDTPAQSSVSSPPPPAPMDEKEPVVTSNSPVPPLAASPQEMPNQEKQKQKPKPKPKEQTSPQKKKETAMTEDGTVGILNFEERFSGDAVPVFTERSTIIAMERLVIEPNAVMRPTEADFAKYPDFPDVREKVAKILEDKRSNLIDQIIEERERVLSEGGHGHATTQGHEEEIQTVRQDALDRVEKLQKREIEQLILSELVRAQTLKDEEVVRVKRENRQRELAEDVKRKQAADLERRRTKEQALLMRIEEKEREVAEIRKKQQEEVERNQRLIAEMKARRMRELADADLAKQKKSMAQREALERQMEEEKKAIIKRQQEHVAKERLMEQRRVERITQLKERNDKIREEQRLRFAASAQKNALAHEEKRRTLEQKEINAQTRFEAVVKNRDAMSQKMRSKTDLQVKRNQDVRETLEKAKEERIRTMVCRDTHDQERRDAIVEKYMERQRRERQIEMEKKAAIDQKNQMFAEKREQDNELYRKKQTDSDKRVEDCKKARDDELAKRVAIQNLKDAIRDENAERRQRQKEYMSKQKGDVSSEREARAVSYRQLRQELAHKKLDASAQLDFKKAAMKAEFAEMMRKGGELDIEGLAGRFNVDIELLKAKAAEASRKKSGEPSTETTPSKPAKSEA